MLVRCNRTKPMDIPRAVRSLKSLKFWKGSEFRVFLLYLGPVFLKDFLDTEVYNHFLMLSCAVRILSCKKYLKSIDIAKFLLENYIKKFIQIYGIDSISSNIHNLCHVVDDVNKFGPLPVISSYPFENYLGYLKSLVRHGNLPLSQIAKRVIELSKLNKSRDVNKSTPFLSKENCVKGKNIYKKVNLADDFVFCADGKNSYFLTHTNEIVLMIHATYTESIKIYGKCINEKYDHFDTPFASSRLDISTMRKKSVTFQKT